MSGEVGWHQIENRGRHARQFVPSYFVIPEQNQYITAMRIGSVPYLNARPLVDWLERVPQPSVTLSYAPPLGSCRPVAAR